MGNLTAKTSGDIASFMTPAETNIKSLKVHFSPKQLGEGDPSPENVREIVGWDGVEVNGCGKNLFDKNNMTRRDGYYYTNGSAESPSTISGYFLEYIRVKPNTTYYISGTIRNAIYLYTLDKTWIKKYSAFTNGRNFTTTDNCFYIRIQYGLSELDIDTIQLEETLTSTSYEPYQGNDILTSWTKNIKQWTYTDTTIDDSYSSNNFNGYANGRWDNAITNIPSEWFGKELTYSAYIERSSSPLNDYDDVRVWCYGDSTTFFDAKNVQRIYTAEKSGRSWVTFTIPEGTTKIGLGLCLSKGSRAYNPQLEYGSEPTEYQPYVGIVYGGYVDLISGELVETHNIITFDGSDDELITHSSNFNDWVQLSEILNMKKGSFFSDNSSVSNRAKKVSSSSNKNELQILIGANNTKTYIYNIARLDSTVTTDETLRNWFLNNPITFTYPLETPITHQLTPTQLKSFVGQNNFWSNADYVEIEYDLIETIDIQKAKQKIILNQPQLKTVSDKVVSFNTDMVAPMKNCKIYFKPIQLGSGDASPTNIRNINGWTGLDSYANGNKVSVDWTSDAGTIYGGYLDLAKGEMVAEWYSLPSTAWKQYKQNNGYKAYCALSQPNHAFGIPIICNMVSKYASFDSNNMTENIIQPHGTVIGEVGKIYLALDENIDISNVQVVWKLTAPIHYPLSSLTSQQLLTLKSENHIWSETNGQQIDVTYWTRKNLTTTPLTNYLENQTWVDSTYISSSGKKTTNTVSASHFLTNQILLEAGTYVLSGFSHYVGTDNTNFRIHAYDSTGKWLRQITFQQIGNLSPVDISFTLDTDTYVNVSIAMDFDGVLAKIN